VCHELGHRDDKEELKLTSELVNDKLNKYGDNYFLVDIFVDDFKLECLNQCIKNEMNAWEHGKKYISEEDLVSYNFMNEEYIAERKRDYEERILSLVELKRKGALNKLENELRLENEKKIN
jgi:uridine kinase